MRTFTFITPLPIPSIFAAPKLSSSWQRRSAAPLPRVSRNCGSNLLSVTACVEVPEWKRVPIDVDFAKDEQLEILEDHLETALFQENYAHASELRNKLQRLQSGAYVSVLSANMKFYSAFEKGSIVDMAGCWLQSKSCTCKHPLGPVSEGYLNILNSFGAIFSMGTISIEPKNVRISMRGSVAYVTCEEHSTEWDAEGKIIDKFVMCAVNIYSKRNGQWYVQHHSSMPIIDKSL